MKYRYLVWENVLQNFLVAINFQKGAHSRGFKGGRSFTGWALIRGGAYLIIMCLGNRALNSLKYPTIFDIHRILHLTHLICNHKIWYVILILTLITSPLSDLKIYFFVRVAPSLTFTFRDSLHVVRKEFFCRFICGAMGLGTSASNLGGRSQESIKYYIL